MFSVTSSPLESVAGVYRDDFVVWNSRNLQQFTPSLYPSHSEIRRSRINTQLKPRVIQESLTESFRMYHRSWHTRIDHLCECVYLKVTADLSVHLVNIVISREVTRYLVLLNKFIILHFGSLASPGSDKVNTMCVPIARLHCQSQTVDRFLYVEMQYYALLKSFEEYSSTKQCLHDFLTGGSGMLFTLN